MSPNCFDDGNVSVFIVSIYGYLTVYAPVNYAYGVRPVINLRADVEITGEGTTSDPFVVVGAS